MPELEIFRTATPSSSRVSRCSNMYCSSSSSVPGLGGPDACRVSGWIPPAALPPSPALSDPPASPALSDPPIDRPPLLRGVAAIAPPAAANPGLTPDRANPMSLIEWRLATLPGCCPGGAAAPPPPVGVAGRR